MSPRRSTSVSPDRIVDAALAIVDDHGLDALTMRRLGSALGVDPMTIYRHIADKEALLDRLVDRVRSEMRIPQPPPERAGDLFAAIFVEYRRALAAHPNVIPLAARRTDTSQQSGLEYLVQSGVPEDDAVAVYQSLAAFTIGYVTLGAPAASKDWDRFPGALGERLHDWSDATFRRTLAIILRGYGLEPEDTMG